MQLDERRQRYGQKFGIGADEGAVIFDQGEATFRMCMTTPGFTAAERILTPTVIQYDRWTALEVSPSL
jgi:hypothetical protein